MDASKVRRPLASLYVLAGLPLGIYSDVLPVFLRSEGMSLSQLGSYSFLYLPYSCKVFFGAVVDCSGRLRRWVRGCSLLLLLAYACLIQASIAKAPSGLALAVIVLTTASALFDTALDASFAGTLMGASDAEHGRANALRLSAFKTAMVLVGSVGVLIGGQYGFATVFTVVGVCHALTLLIVPLAHLDDRPSTQTAASWLQSGVAWLRRPGIGRVFLLAFLFKLSIATLLFLEKAYWLDRGMSIRSLGVATACTGLAGTVAGANVGSRLAGRYGFRPLLVGGLVSQSLLGLAYLSLAYLPATSLTLGLGLICSGLTFGVSTAALMNLTTRTCEPLHVATQFAALTGCYAVARSLGGLLGGRFAEAYGFTALFVLVAALPLPAALLLARRSTLAAIADEHGGS